MTPSYYSQTKHVPVSIGSSRIFGSLAMPLCIKDAGTLTKEPFDSLTTRYKRIISEVLVMAIEVKIPADLVISRKDPTVFAAPVLTAMPVLPSPLGLGRLPLLP
ncbi:hypothetical protein TNIN_334621 [Trichonephila inaurata madagascariensis]|uniref:Uncharacterized protein n=1 Tax=Trichonephila inaurata madagascariensis TaxID=2747483 RepID=A0A8X6YBU5_9ARAC|nr:hypothetical protein TNIN_334621 [Trichonephila inaurata madagascariensis]